MLRLILLLLLLAMPAARAAVLPQAAPLVPAPTFPQLGPAKADGALVWLHGAYDSRVMPPPPPVEWVAHMAARHLDVWRYNRISGQDSLAAGEQGLARGLRGLRQAGYRRIVVAGFSRGGWIALTALRHPGLADAVVALSPAAHGTSPEKQRRAMQAWDSLWRGVAPGGTRVVLVQLRDDPYDPDPPHRAAIARTASRRAGYHLLSIYLPDQPRGHLGSYDPLFDARFGDEITRFVDPSPAHSKSR